MNTPYTPIKKKYEKKSLHYILHSLLPEKEDIKGLIRSVLRKRSLTHPLYNKQCTRERNPVIHRKNRSYDRL